MTNGASGEADADEPQGLDDDLGLTMSSEPKPAVSKPSDYTALLASSVFANGLSLIRSLVVIPLVPPAAFGQYRYVLALIAYLNNLDIGAISLLNVRYPRAVAAGSVEDASQMLAASFQLCAMGGLLSGLILFGATVGAHIAAPPLLAALSVLVALSLPSQFANVRLRVAGSFPLVARYNIQSTALGVASVIVGTVIWGYEGLLIGSVLSFLFFILLAREYAAPPGWRTVRLKVIKRVVWTGGRISVSELANETIYHLDIVLLTLLVGIDRTLLGYYGLATLLVTNVGNFAAAISSVEAVRISETAGRVDHLGDQRFVDHVESAIARDSFITLAVCTVLAVGVAGLSLTLLSAYSPAVPVMGAILAGTVPRRWRRYGAHVLALADRVRWSNVATTMAVAIAVGGFLLVHLAAHDSLVGYAVVRLAAELIPAVFIVIAALLVALRPDAARIWVRRTLVANAPLLVLIIGPAVTGTSVGLATSGVLTFFGMLLTYRWTYPQAGRDSVAMLRSSMSDVRRGLRQLAGRWRVAKSAGP